MSSSCCPDSEDSVEAGLRDPILLVDVNYRGKDLSVGGADTSNIIGGCEFRPTAPGGADDYQKLHEMFLLACVIASSEVARCDQNQTERQSSWLEIGSSESVLRDRKFTRSRPPKS